jgi:ABC-2 type transport system ATP-binding protein
MSALIEAKKLSRFYGKQCAVNDVSFSLGKGEILGFLGKNGAGKTTTMQMLCGCLAPSAGEILINGIDLLDQPIKAKSFLGYLPDTPPLYKELTVTEFLDYCARLHRLTGIECHQALNKALQRCGLENVRHRLIGQLSKGYQQRVGIAQAILHDPDVIVLDEPTVGLDPAQMQEIRQLIKQLGTDHGIILSTHILSEVQQSCTHVQIIDQGRLILKETIDGLNQRMNSERIRLVTRIPVDCQTLLELDGITNIEALASNEYIIHFHNQAAITDALAQCILENHWGLIEISPIKVSMEEIFIHLTQATNS